MKTYRQVIEANGGEPAEVEVELGEYTGKDADKGLTLKAWCFTDDDDLLDSAAAFDISTSWGDIGRYDNMHGELDGALCALANKVAAKFGGDWRYDAADGMFYQAEA